MIIRPLQYDDIDKVYEIECEVFPQPWSIESLKAEFESEKSHYLIVELEGVIVGYGGFWKIFDEGHITNIAIDPHKQGEGLGGKLLDAMLLLGHGLDIHDFTLEVRASNESAKRLYKSRRFEEAGLRKGFYDYPKEDALIMWLHGNELG